MGNPVVTDLDKNGTFDILMSADITQNNDAGTNTGGIFHVLDSNGKSKYQWI